ncbi:hypothetical protein [Paenirhodobacter populi]|uniref:hypothetical protein n=1 Tax=Paenirhodobacter populi TaxID=2306993 RepID=UPI000FE3186E|nr:hypothetical protein [Sinirhodobacter populi]
MFFMPPNAQGVAAGFNLRTNRNVPSSCPVLAERSMRVDHLVAYQLETALPGIELAREKQRNAAVEISAHPVKLVAILIRRNRSIGDCINSISQPGVLRKV